MEVSEIGEGLTRAGRLGLEPLAICVARDGREVPIGEVNRCVARAVFLVARGESGPVRIDDHTTRDVCPGARGWLGLGEMHERLKYFVSSGTPDFRGGQAEYLKRTPDLVEISRERLGRIRFPGGALVVKGCSQVTEEDVLSVICFADALGARNLCALAHFGSDDPTGVVLVPWGPMCASLITYPARMAERYPEAVALGPMDPTVNPWFPASLLSLGIPLGIAERMVDDLERSFLAKRPEVAYPTR